MSPDPNVSARPGAVAAQAAALCAGLPLPEPSRPPAGTGPAGHAAKRSYGQILKSSALIGGSSLLNAVFGIVRTKAMAMLLGPSGVGLLGLYTSISETTRTLAGLGINSSGVRQIAEAVGTGDGERIACTVTTLRRVALVSGVVGALLLVLLCKPVSWLSFKNYEHAGAVALLALAAFFGDISAAQAALVQGMRRIADLARMTMLGALYGTVFSVVIVYFFKEQGVVPSLVCVAAMSIVTSWWYARKIKVRKMVIPSARIFQEASSLVRLGLVFMVSGLATQGTGWLVRAIVLRRLGFDAAGFYQAAWSLGGLYIGFILTAMGADFYPRLTGIANRHEEVNRLVNEQAEVGLLLAGPGILGTLTFAPLVITLFYRGDFSPAVEILRWICLGMMLRVVTWPLGYIILAKGARKIFFWTELLSSFGYVGFIWAGVHFFGLQGTGIAFFALYVLHLGVVYMIVRRLTGFRWSPVNRKLAMLFAPVVAAVFASWYFLPMAGVGKYIPRLAATLFGLAVTVALGIFSLRTLCKLIPLERLPRLAQKLIKLFKLAPLTTD